jgi:hypothetical protein
MNRAVVGAIGSKRYVEKEHPAAEIRNGVFQELLESEDA